MCCIRRSVFIDHIIWISMIGSEKNCVIIFKSCRYYFFNTSIYCFYSFDGCFPHPGMSYHICISIIKTDEIGRLVFYFGKQSIRYFVSTHFRLHIIGCNLRWGDQNSFFAFKWFFSATTKEKSNMWIFFRFGYPYLL